MSDEKPHRRVVASRYSPKSGEGPITAAAIRKGNDPEVEVLLAPTARMVPKIGALLGDTFHVVEKELARMKAAQGGGTYGGEISVRDLKLLGDLLFQLSKEIREDEKRNDVSKLDDESALREALKDPYTRQLVIQILSEYEE